MTTEEVSQLTVIIEKIVAKEIAPFKQEFTDYVKSDLSWKEDAKPSIELGRNVNGFGRVLAYILGTIAAIYGIIRLFK